MNKLFIALLLIPLVSGICSILGAWNIIDGSIIEFPLSLAWILTAGIGIAYAIAANKKIRAQQEKLDAIKEEARLNDIFLTTLDDTL